MLGCAANQQQYSPEMTGFPAPTERHCCGMIEGLGPSGILPRRLDRQCGASVVTARDAVVNRTEIRSCRRSLPTCSLCCCLPRPSTRTVPLTLPGYPKGAVAKKAITRLLKDRLVEEIRTHSSLSQANQASCGYELSAVTTRNLVFTTSPGPQHDLMYLSL